MNYRTYLRGYLKEHGIRQRDLAEVVGLSPPWLSQILNGHRRLQPDLAERIADALKFNSARRLHFLTLVESEVGNSTIIRGRARSLLRGIDTPEFSDVTAPEFQDQLSDWHIGAILELSRCEEYQPNARWIAATLRPTIPEHRAQQAMDALREGGYFDDGYRLISNEPMAGTRREVGDKDEARRLAEHYTLVFELAQRALTLVPANDRLMLGGIMALSEKDFRTMKARFQEIIIQTLAGASEETPNRVYQFCSAFFPISLYSDSTAGPWEFEDDDRP